MGQKDIFSVSAQEILDSRGTPTIYCKVSTQDGVTGWSEVPSGVSTGKHEAHELRDKDKLRYHGKGVQHAVFSINNTIHHALRGKSILDQRQIDEFLINLDGTKDKSRLGANALLAVSMAVSRCAAAYLHKPLYVYLRNLYWNFLDTWKMPVPFMNIINGGKHAQGSIPMQEFMIVPYGATRFAQALQWGVEIYHSLKQYLLQKHMPVGVGDEGGFMPKFLSLRQVLDTMVSVIKMAGYIPGVHVGIAIDPASSEFYKDGKYYLSTEKSHLGKEEMIALYTAWASKYPLCSIEDGLYEDDWEGFRLLTQTLGDSVQIVGDDLFATNPIRIEKGIKMHSANCILIKPNQIGTVTETADAIRLAQKNNISVMISHRSGETEDTYIADLAVASNAGQIKAGAPARGERVAKYNRLLIIEKELNTLSLYAPFPFNKT